MPQARRYLSDEEVDVAVKLLAEGRTYEEIGRKLGLSASGMWRALNRTVGSGELPERITRARKPLKQRAARVLLENGFNVFLRNV